MQFWVAKMTAADSRKLATLGYFKENSRSSIRRQKRVCGEQIAGCRIDGVGGR
jgi:hypothetical protein